MPVEIKELVIRAVVRDDADEGAAAAAGLSEEQQEALVEACVREVMKALRRARER